MENQQSKTRKMISWICSGLVIAFLAFDIFGKFIQPEEVLKGTTELGYPESSILTMGILLFISTLFYVIPKTSVIGAILLTGYFGGAVATHFRISNPVLSHTLFPVYLGVLIWVGLALRNTPLKKVLVGS
ncbi:DoxX family protein [Algoriphagus aestuarii]|nr:DoxX family protein [Algoriphagus aestuarii]